jgi:hypothetical protein
MLQTYLQCKECGIPHSHPWLLYMSGVEQNATHSMEEGCREAESFLV